MPLRTVRALLIVFLLSLSASFAFAQSGRFSGQVTDPEGAAIPSATVQVINQETLIKREATTDASGMFSVAYLPAIAVPARATFETTSAQPGLFRGSKVTPPTGFAVTSHTGREPVWLTTDLPCPR